MSSRWSLRGRVAPRILIAFTTIAIAVPVFAQGTLMFPTQGVSDKPQSKLWVHDGFWWACMNNSTNLEIYKLDAGTWTSMLVLQAAATPSFQGGTSDALWDGTHLFVAVFGLSTSKIYKLSYDSLTTTYSVLPGFPKSLTMSTGAETIVLDKDSTGRVWATYEAGGKVYVYYSTSSDHTQWIASPLQINTQTVDADDISTIVAFGGDKIGVLWTDQRQQQVCFRWRHDTDLPTAWQPVEIARSGFGCSDDHINMKADSQGRIYFAAKDYFDAVWVGKRDLDGTWTVTTGASGLDCGTRPILQIDESQNKLYVFYTRWEACVSTGTHAIEERVSYLDNLLFSLPAVVIAGSGVSMNEVQGTKQLLPAGSLAVVCEGSDGRAYWTGWGSVSGIGGSDPGGNFPPPPAPPSGLAADIVTEDPQSRMLLWRLDQSSGSTATDASGNNRTGTLGTGIAAPTWTTGLVNNGLYFNGDAYVTASGTPFAFTGQSFTLEAWVKIDLTNAPGTGVLFSRADLIHSTFELSIKDPYIEFGWSTGDTTDVTVKAHESLRDGAWHHVAAVYDAAQTEARIYVDGTEQVTKIMPPAVYADAWGLTVGALKSGAIIDKAFTGWMDLVSIANTAVYNGSFTPPLLYPSSSTDYVRVTWTPSSSVAGIAGYQVQRGVNGGAPTVLNALLTPNSWYADFSPIDGFLDYGVRAVDGLTQQGVVGTVPLVWESSPPAVPSAPQDLSYTFEKVYQNATPFWEFEEGEGSVTVDGSGLGHTARLGSTVVGDNAEPSWVFGMTGKALRFDGTNDWAEVPDAPDLRLPSSFTVEAWIMPSQLGRTQAILSKDQGSSKRNFLLQMTSSNFVEFLWRTGSSTRRVTSTVAITDLDWHHVAGVFDDALNQSFVYLDGVQVGSTGTSGSPYTGPEPVYIGARGSSTAGDQSDPFRGTIDLVRLTKGILYNGPFTPPDLYRGGPKVNAVRLAWGGPATGLVNQYLVYRQELPSGANTLIGTLAYSPLPSLLDAAVTPELTYRYTVRATNSDGDPSSASAPLDVTMVVPTDVAGETAPGVSGPRLRLEPNPFNPTATITFRLERTGPVDLALYDARGRRVATVVHGNLPQGEHRVQVFGGRDARLASGVYFLSLRADGRDTRLKAVLVR